MPQRSTRPKLGAAGYTGGGCSRGCLECSISMKCAAKSEALVCALSLHLQQVLSFSQFTVKLVSQGIFLLMGSEINPFSWFVTGVCAGQKGTSCQRLQNASFDSYHEKTSTGCILYLQAVVSCYLGLTFAAIGALYFGHWRPVWREEDAEGERGEDRERATPGK